MNNTNTRTELELRADISEIISKFTDDYASRIEAEIIDDVMADVAECSDFENGIWTNGDITLSIGRVLCDRLGIEI